MGNKACSLVYTGNKAIFILNWDTVCFVLHWAKYLSPHDPFAQLLPCSTSTLHQVEQAQWVLLVAEYTIKYLETIYSHTYTNKVFGVKGVGKQIRTIETEAAHISITWKFTQLPVSFTKIEFTTYWPHKTPLMMQPIWQLIIIFTNTTINIQKLRISSRWAPHEISTCLSNFGQELESMFLLSTPAPDHWFCK